LTPFTVGCVVGALAPVAINTLAGVMVALELSLLLRLTVTPPEGAGVPSVTANVADWPGPTDTFVGSTIAPGLVTVAFSVAEGTNAAEAVMCAVPGATPVTGTWMDACGPPPGGKVAVVRTVAIPVASETRLTVRPPAGAADASVNVAFTVVVPGIVIVDGANVMVAFTVT
jgi:hypothetical protein